MSSFVEESINKLIRDLINDILDQPGFAIKAKQNAPRPEGSYASVNVSSISQIGWDESKLEDRTEDPDIDNTVSGDRLIMISLQFYREGAKDNAHAVHIGLMRNFSIETFRAANLGFTKRSEVRGISEPLEDGWESRAQFDLYLSTVATDNEIIRSIEIIEIDGEFQTRGKTIPVDIKVE